ncbi:MAG TPA: serine/threonine-protein kinase [Gemmataceae bacterium]|jgi:serine/threonine protein kinase
MPPLPHVPGYDLLRPLGGGPLTEVFAARRHADDRPCAVKLPREVWPGHTTAVRLLRREYRALRAVRHPHVVRLLDAHVTDPPYFLALEFLAGETLRDRLQRDYALDLRTTAWVARQTAEALAALHRAGFVHGDVKPENVRLSDAGTAVLVDLGFTHRPGENGVFADDGYVLGTANYLAPELCGDDPRDGPAADWFSFGVTLFETLTGTLPYPRGPVAEMLEQRRQDVAAEALTAVARSWPPRLTGLLEGLLARQPAARPPDALVVHELIALEIAALGLRRAG